MPPKKQHDITVNIKADDEVLAKLDEILDILHTSGAATMATLDDIRAEVESTGTVVDSAVVLIDGLHQALVDALASNDPEAVQAIVDQLAQTKQELAAAVDSVPHAEAQ